MAKRKWTKQDKKMATQFAKILSGLDKLVFPDNPIPKIRFFSDTKPKKIPYISYGFKKCKSRKNDCYTVFGCGFSKKVRLQCNFKQHLIWGQRKKNGRIKDVELFDSKHPLRIKDVLFGMAAHEVRHRLQFHRLIRLIKKNCSRFYKDIYLFYLKQIAAKSTFGLYKYYKGNNAKRREDEFDATMVEYLVISLIHYGHGCADNETALKKLASIIMIKPSQLRKEFFFEGVPVFEMED